MQEINNPREEAIEQYLLQDAEVDNSNGDAIEQNLLQEAEVDNFRGEELLSLVTTRLGRVSILPEQLQDFFCRKINEFTDDKQTKNNGDVSSGMTSPVVCENTAPLEQDNLFLLLTARGGPNQREIRSFVFTPAAKILSFFSYQLEHQAGRLLKNVDGLSRQTPCLDCMQCAAIGKRDRGPSRAGLETELQGRGEIQAK